MASRSRWTTIIAVLALLPVLYVLSEALLVRLTGGVPYGGLWSLYRPADWLIDPTPLGDLLMAWSQMCGVGRNFELSRRVRETAKELEKFPSLRLGEIHICEPL